MANEKNYFVSPLTNEQFCRIFAQENLLNRME